MIFDVTYIHKAFGECFFGSFVSSKLQHNVNNNNNTGYQTSLPPLIMDN